MVTLRVTPVHGDTLHAELGAPATPASMKVDGQRFDTADLRVSFLAVGSTGEHETGEPVEWRNRITLQSREYAAGNERRVELRAAPPAPIRYTTDGSGPMVAGGAYDGPFAAPEGARVVLAVAEKDGVVSELHRRDLAEKPVERPIDRALPATWTPARALTFQSTRTAHGFIERLRRHLATARSLRLTVEASSGRSSTWSELHLSDDLALDAERIEAALDHLRGLVAEGEASIEIRYLQFESGQRFLDYVGELRIDFRRDEVEQSS